MKVGGGGRVLWDGCGGGDDVFGNVGCNIPICGIFPVSCILIYMGRNTRCYPHVSM